MTIHVPAGKYCWTSFALLLLPLLGCATTARSQVETAQSIPPLTRPQEFKARVLRAEANRLELQLADSQEQRVINLPPETLAKLRLAPEHDYTVLAEQRPTFGAVNTALRLKDERGLYALAENISDQPLFKPEEREGMKVELQPAQDRTLVYEDSCKIVYNVPTAFTLGDQRLVLQAYESKTVQLNGASYTLALHVSQFVVLKECELPYEGGRTQIDYSMVRNP